MDINVFAYKSSQAMTSAVEIFPYFVWGFACIVDMNNSSHVLGSQEALVSKEYFDARHCSDHIVYFNKS